MPVATYLNRYCKDLKHGWCIQTEYEGPTDTYGPRIYATCQRDNDTLWEIALEPSSDLETIDNHRNAAQLLIDRLSTIWTILNNNLFYRWLIKVSRVSLCLFLNYFVHLFGIVPDVFCLGGHNQI